MKFKKIETSNSGHRHFWIEEESNLGRWFDDKVLIGVDTRINSGVLRGGISDTYRKVTEEDVRIDFESKDDRKPWDTEKNRPLWAKWEWKYHPGFRKSFIQIL